MTREEYLASSLLYDDFIFVNQEELNCIFAESGADREEDFDFDSRTEQIWSEQERFKKEFPQLEYTYESM